MKIWLSLPLFAFLGTAYSQQSEHYIISTQGSLSKGETMTLSWTIGDLTTEAAVMNETLITQGFQQPVITVREIDSAKPENFVSRDQHVQGAAISQRNSTDFDATVFPNPFGTDITVKVENDSREYSLDVFDAAGNLISKIKSSNPQEVINLYGLPANQYVLRISLTGTEESKVFQITKAR